MYQSHPEDALLKGLPAALMDGFMVAVVHPSGQLALVNDHMAKALGHTAQALTGQPLQAIASESGDGSSAADVLGYVANSRCWLGKMLLNKVDGHTMLVQTTVVPLKSPEGALEHVLILATSSARRLDFPVLVSNPQDSFFGMLEGLGTPVILHREGSVVYANQAALNLTGYTLSAIKKLPYAMLTHPDHREQLTQRIQARLRGETTHTRFENTLQTANGKQRMVEQTVGLLPVDGQLSVLDTYVDQTAQRQNLAAQAHMRRILAQIIDGNPVPTIVIDGKHTITHWNRACELVTGFKSEDMVGTQNQWMAFYPEARPILADLMVSGAEDAEVAKYYVNAYKRSPIVPDAYEGTGLFTHMGSNGRWLEFTAAPVRNLKGQVIGAVETLVDVTERKLAEIQLKAANDNLERLVSERTQQLATANAQLAQSEKLASIGQLAAGVAHEINNPIGYVHSNIGSLQTYMNDLMELLSAYEQLPANADIEALRQKIDVDFLREDMPSLISESQEGITRVKKIVQDLKDFSRVDSSQDFQTADLHDGINSTLNIVNNEIKYKADVVKAYGQLPPVECLPSQLNQVFMNLLVNAAHAMGETRGTITITTGTEGDRVWLTFADNGSGISPDNLSRIFDPFFTTKPVGKGTGLGLSLTYGIIQKHHGHISVQSVVGQGTTFRIELPIHQSPEPTQEDTADA